jgi:hypothetical protein
MTSLISSPQTSTGSTREASEILDGHEARIGRWPDDIEFADTSDFGGTAKILNASASASEFRRRARRAAAYRPLAVTPPRIRIRIRMLLLLSLRWRAHGKSKLPFQTTQDCRK